MKIKNFRGYREATEIDFNDLTVFVGKNDVGKSTVLEALDIFFNDSKGTIKIDKTDINNIENQAGNTETEITVCFKELPDTVLIDSTVETSLQEEYLLNEEGILEVIKRYKNGGASKVYIRALHPTNTNCSELLFKNNTALKKIIQDNGIVCANLTTNTVIRKAIWNHYSDDLQSSITEIDASKEDAKIIWNKLSPYLPVYSLFQSDRKNSDGDDEVQDPLKEAVKQILNDEQLQLTLNQVATEVEGKLREVASRTLEKLREMDPSIANSLNPVIPTASSLKWQDVFKGVSISGDDNIPINKRGSGVKRLVLLNFFRAEAERRFSESDNSGVIYAIEEPETSQHTDNQKMLIEAFKTLATTENVQVILTTHSAFIVKQLEFCNLRLIVNDEQNEKHIMDVLPGQLQYPSLNEVNYVAFEEVLEEYHDELYSYIEFQGWKRSYIQGKETRRYNRQLPNGDIREEQKILTEYIRHQIHHPENRENERFNIVELRESIDLMRSFIKDTVETIGVSEP